MGQKYVVFVEESLVLGSVQMAASGALGIGRDAGMRQLSIDQELTARRGVLSSLASTLTGGSAAGIGATSSAADRMSAGAAATDSTDDRVQILEGISAIVVDDESVEIASLLNIDGLTVVANFELSLPTPVAVSVEAAAMTPLNHWHQQKIGLTSGQPGGHDILIGVLDTGIDAGHSEFAGKTIHFAEFNGAGRLISTTPRDAGDHGTHVCSTAAGALAGIAPNADLAVAAVLTHRNAMGQMSGSLVQIVNGFNWLITTKFRDGVFGADIVNASLGGSGFHTYLQSSVRTALRLGVPMIAAIGNDGRGGPGRHGSPGNYPEVLGVGASDQADVIADFSDWGVTAPPTGPAYPVPALCAPGVLVHAAKPSGGFQAMSGTSMATPVVTGVAARRMAANRALIGNPAALFTDLRARLAPYRPHPLGNRGGAGRIVA